MKNFQNILAVVDPDPIQQYAVEKALLLASKTNAKLTLLSISRKKSLFSPWLSTSSENTLSSFYRQNYSEKAQHNGLQVDVKEVHNAQVYQAVLDELANQSYDLVVKNLQEYQQHWFYSLSGNAHLLRDCNANVLLVGDKNWPAHGQILTALETEEKTRKHRALNRMLLNESRYIARILNSDIHLLNCYQENVSVASAFGGEALSNKDLYQQHFYDLCHSAQAYQLGSDHLHVKSGLPDFVIPAQAEKYNANIVVLGAGEHHGLMSAIKGHTAEYIIEQLNCDALILKARPELLH